MDTDIRLVQETFYICSVCRQDFESIHDCIDHEAKCNCTHQGTEYTMCLETFVILDQCSDCGRVMEITDMVERISKCPLDIRQIMLHNLRDAVILPDNT